MIYCMVYTVEPLMVMPSATFGAQVWHTAPPLTAEYMTRFCSLMAQAAMEHIRIFPR